MIISHTTYSKFLGNWESARLTKGLGLVSNDKKPALERGGWLHARAEGYFYNWPAEKYLEAQREEGYSDEGVKEGDLLWPTLKEYIDSRPGKLIAAEMKTEGHRGLIIPIPGTPHSLECRVDALYEHGGIIQVDEYKSTNPRKTPDQMEIEYLESPQTRFVLLAARHYTGDNRINTVKYVTIQEGTPPLSWPMDIPMDESQLQLQLRYAAQVCDVIEFLIERYGLEDPWVHHIPKWTCYKCDLKDICGQRFETGECPDGFTLREDSWQKQRLLLPSSVSSGDGQQ